MGELKHENLSSILGTEHEIFSIDYDAPPTFREQKERTGTFFLTEKIQGARKEDTQTALMFQFKDDDENLYDSKSVNSDDLLF